MNAKVTVAIDSGLTDLIPIFLARKRADSYPDRVEAIYDSSDG